MIVIMIWLITVFAIVKKSNDKSEENLQEIRLKYQQLMLISQNNQKKLTKIYDLRNAESKKDYIYEKYLPIEEAMKEASLYIYEDNKYTCIDFSENLQELLKEINIESSLIIGHRPNYHQWLAIWIEPQDGSFVTIEKNYKFEQVIEKNYWGSER